MQMLQVVEVRLGTVELLLLLLLVFRMKLRCWVAKVLLASGSQLQGAGLQRKKYVTKICDSRYLIVANTVSSLSLSFAIHLSLKCSFNSYPKYKANI
jgi:hypothetical protein